MPSGISLEIKNNNNDLTPQGVPIILVIKKGIITKEISGFKAKRSLSNHEEYANKLKALSTKEIAISATSGDVTTNKNAILNAIQTLTNFPTVPSGISLEIKDDATNLTLAGIPITLIVKKQNENDLEISGFFAKRSQTDQEMADDYKNELEKSFYVTNNSPVPTKTTIKIDSESGTIEENKTIIINTIKNSYDFVFPPIGFDIRLKANQNETITLEGVMVDVEIFKIDNQNTLALMENLLKVSRSYTMVESQNSDYEKIKNHFSNDDNKNIGIPFESTSKNYTQLTQEGVLEAVRKALVFSDPVFWTKTLLNKISLRGSNAITNFDTQRTITIKYGPKGAKSNVKVQVQKYSIKKTITDYFNYKNNKFIIIPFNVENSISASSILEKVKNVLLYKNTELWQNLKDYLYVSDNNKLNTLEATSDDTYRTFKISYAGPQDSKRKKLNLEVKHFTNYQQIQNYFQDQKNKMIDISAVTLPLNTANKILEAIKVNLSIKESSIWTKELQDNLKISASNQTTSLVKGDFPKKFIVEYRFNTYKLTIILKVKHLEK